MEDLVDFIPGGPWTIAAVGLLSVPAVRRQVRPVAKAVVRAGLAAADGLREFVAEAREQTEDLVAEVQAERNGGAQASAEPQATRARRGRTEAVTP
jgi:hypothetical protein